MVKARAITYWVVICLWLTTTVLLAQSDSPPEAIRQYRAAVALQNKQLYELAVEEWATFLKQFPEDSLASEAEHYLGVCYFQLKQYAPAEDAFRRAVEGVPSKLQAASLLNLGLAQFNLGQAGERPALQRASATLERLRQSYPESPEAQQAIYYAAESLYGLGQPEAAGKLYESALRENPQHPRREQLLYGLGIVLQQRGDHQRARQIFERLLREYPAGETAAEVTTRRGDTLFALKQYAAAEQVFSAVAAQPDSPFADYGLWRQAACQFQQTQYAAAGRLYADHAERFSQSEHVAAAVVAAGKCFYLAGDTSLAEEWLAKAEKLPGDTALEACHWRARLDIQARRAEQALPTIEAAVAKAGDSQWAPQLQLDLADALYELPQRRPEALRRYAQLADRYADHELAPQARYLAAFTALEERDYDQAQRHVRQFLDSHSDHDLLPDVTAVLAECQLQQGQWAEAFGTWQGLLQRYPDRPARDQWISRSALCLHQQDRPAELISWLPSRLPELKQPSAQGEAEYLLGSAFSRTGQLPQARRYLAASYQTDPDGPQADRALFALAEVEQQAQQPREALAAIGRLLDGHPDSELRGEAHFLRAELLYEAGEFAPAAEAYRAALQSPPDADLQPHALLGLAWSQLSLKEYAAATQTLTQLRQVYPRHELVGQSDYALGVALQQQQQFAAAAQALDRFLASQPDARDRADALYVRGLCQAGLKQFDAAAISYRELLQVDPEYPDADQVVYELAWALQSSDQPQKAALAFQQLAERYPASSLTAEAWYRWAEYEYGQRRYRTAAQAYRSAAQKADRTALEEQAMHKLGWALYQQDEYQAAAEAFATQLQYHPQGDLAVTAQLMAAECAFQQQQHQPALDGFAAALQSAGGSESLRALSLLHAGQAAGQLQRWEDALRWLQQGSRDYPQSEVRHEMNYERARALQQLRRADEALDLYQQVADATTTPVAARARFMAGEIQFDKQQFSEAIRTFFKVAYGFGYPQSPPDYHRWQADAMFEAARCCESTQRWDAARQLYTELLEHFPDSDKAETAKKKLAALPREG